ncbi:uncharacterized protein LOC107267918 [Cephus cinctus]|uniref:arylamine N-acetyltransferase n=1 Tax=Cephus cinctus TaxID=211228 RepID=A0AAJ7BWY2_CEPCN|nr:uncharacterized protein LOC107267918 [Cephus cinctus]
MDFEAAKSFVQEKLGVEYVSEKVTLLQKIVRAFSEKLPFQNISVSILDAGARFPTEENVISVGKSLSGGVCIHNNWFMKILLQALGYNVYFVAGYSTESQKKTLGSHIGIVVKNLTNANDLHLIDVGSRYPLFKPVPLNSLPYEATDVTLTYRFVEENGQWHREHKNGTFSKYTRYITYDKSLRSSVNDFRIAMEEVLQENWLIGTVLAVRYLQPNSKDIPGVPDFHPQYDYMAEYSNRTITFENSTGYKYTERVGSDQIEFTVRQYFPSIPKEDVAKRVAAIQEEPDRPWYQCRML